MIVLIRGIRLSGGPMREGSPKSLQSYRLLGRSGLRVSPLSLGTMTFGSEWGWGAERDEARRIFNDYVEQGGNFIDTANHYTDGTAEKLIGSFAAGRRDRLVIATKYTLPIASDDPNAGGNHRKSMIRSVERSLRHLGTDYIDLLYVHAWDGTTGVDEIMRAMDDLVRLGKVLYLGISNVPAWQIARMQTSANHRGWSPFIALQVEYNLIERTPERDLIPMARELGLGIVPWSPLGGGILTGKYREAHSKTTATHSAVDGLRGELLGNVGRLTPRALAIAEVVKKVAEDAEKSPAQIALAWTLANSEVVSPIIGARTFNQFRENLGCLQVEFTEAQLHSLAEASAVDSGFPHEFLKWLTASSFMATSMPAARSNE